MNCSNCNSENSASEKLCGQCGRPLVERCSNCGAEAPQSARYCPNCGTFLLDSTQPGTDLGPSSQISTKTPGITENLHGERRHLTILFCDVVGSTEIASKLDPEDWLSLVSIYQKAVTESVVRFGGIVARFVGDGVLAFFGYPEAHEDDPERAVRAGLATIESIETVNRQLQGSGRPHLSVRIGIDTGPVVVSTAQGRDPDAFGDTPNIAAKVQTVAETEHGPNHGGGQWTDFRALRKSGPWRSPAQGNRRAGPCAVIHPSGVRVDD